VFNCITGFYKPTAGGMRLTHGDGHNIQLERLNDFRISKQAKVDAHLPEHPAIPRHDGAGEI